MDKKMVKSASAIPSGKIVTANQPKGGLAKVKDASAKGGPARQVSDGGGNFGTGPSEPNPIPGGINGPATVSDPIGAGAVRNPTPSGGSSSTPGGPPNLPVSSTGRGKSGKTKNQKGITNRRNPRDSNSLTEEELRKAAMRRLGG